MKIIPPRENHPDTDKKYLVLSNCLDQLLKCCTKCSVTVTGQKKKTIGSMLTIEMICLDGHINHWDYQPIINRKPSRLASYLNLQFISESVFYDTQRQFVFPVLNQAWENEKQMVRQEMVNKSAINLHGDGRCDSLGHNTKSGTYTLMDDNTGKVAAFIVVQVSKVTYSDTMEKEGFKRCIESLEGDGIGIDCIATDRRVHH